MDFNTYSFPGNAVLRVLAAEVIFKEEKGDEMWFESGGVLHRFGKQEFAVMTGLKFGPINIDITDLERKPLSEDGIVGRLFPRATNMKVSGLQIEDRLYKHMERLDDKDAEKLMNVLIVYNFLLGNPISKAVSSYI